jgi:hypothetical protein
MKKQHYANESGSMDILGHKMEWTMKRSKTASAFGVCGSRIFYLEMKKDGKVVGLYDRGWSVGKKIDKEDEEGMLCLRYLVDKYGKDIPKKKREMGHSE